MSVPTGSGVTTISKLPVTAQLAITEQPAHGTFETDDGAVNFWVGARRTDEQTSAAGYYRTVEDGDVEFRPLIGGLKHDEAELLARLLHSEIGGDFATVAPACRWDQRHERGRAGSLLRGRAAVGFHAAEAGTEPGFRHRLLADMHTGE